MSIATQERTLTVLDTRHSVYDALHAMRQLFDGLEWPEVSRRISAYVIDSGHTILIDGLPLTEGVER